MTIKNGDLPASPICYDARMMAAYSKGEAMGLSKREHFAALAMQGILANSTERIHDGMFGFVASSAVKQADAILSQLERTK